jgi:hypothetical protein
MAAATLLLRYAPLASTSDKTTSYTVSQPSHLSGQRIYSQNFAQGQIDYMLGKNPMNGKLGLRLSTETLTNIQPCTWLARIPIHLKTHILLPLPEDLGSTIYETALLSMSTYSMVLWSVAPLRTTGSGTGEMIGSRQRSLWTTMP